MNELCSFRALLEQSHQQHRDARGNSRLGVLMVVCRVQTIIHWFRRDLRISDNTSLHEAWSRSECLVPVYIFDDAFWRAPDIGAARAAFSLRSLESLAKNLDALGHRLIVRWGSPAEVLVKLARETKATAVYANREYEPDATARDQRIATELYQAGIYFESFKDLVIWEGREILTRTAEPYTVFTPYSKAWRARPLPPPVPRLGNAKSPVVARIDSDPLPTDTAAFGYPLSQTVEPAGEHAAQRQLEAFLQSAVFDYERTRNFPANDSGTSRLSPHLRAGTIGIRTILAKLRQAAESASARQHRSVEVWEGELIWREFYQQILANFPHVAAGSFRHEYDRLEWSGTDAQFEAWCAGQTGYPIVDAAMRCLSATGWMHNRLRMIVAMFLTKDLLISWQRGERYFMRQLADGDLAANNGGWQWSAGTGTDAAPYFRIFNSVTQGQKFDPEGEFVRRWVPELADADSGLIHTPWKSPELLGQLMYPPPIVDHARQRDRCLAMFKAVKE